jgi:hypothetical protein
VTKSFFRGRHDAHTCEQAILNWKIAELEKLLAEKAGLRIVAWPKLDAAVSPTECRAYGDVTVEGEILTAPSSRTTAEVVS